MILCLDIGNSQIYGGIYDDDKLLVTFRKSSQTGASSDELGIFLRGVIRENGLKPELIKQISICSVVPDWNHSINNACLKYFECTPFFLQPGAKSGLKIRYHNPLEVGSDRIANAVGAVQMYPDCNLIIIDFGTATTFCAITATKEYLGGVILPGVRTSMEALEAKTAKLPKVEIIKTQTVVGRSTVESIQSGLYWGHVAAVEKLKTEITRECFACQPPVTIGTGGFVRFFEDQKLFDAVLPNLVLQGLHVALDKNS